MQYMVSQRVGADGLPVFNLFVRTPLKNVSHADLGLTGMAKPHTGQTATMDGMHARGNGQLKDVVPLRKFQG